MLPAIKIPKLSQTIKFGLFLGTKVQTKEFLRMLVLKSIQKKKNDYCQESGTFWIIF